MTPFFFVAGASFAYFVAMPWALKFLLGFEGEVGGVTQEALPAIGNYHEFRRCGSCSGSASRSCCRCC